MSVILCQEPFEAGDVKGGVISVHNTCSQFHTENGEKVQIRNVSPVYEGFIELGMFNFQFSMFSVSVGQNSHNRVHSRYFLARCGLLLYDRALE